MSLLLFPNDPLQSSEPDPAYSEEVVAVQAAGAQLGLMSYEALTLDQSPARAVRRLPQRDDPALAVYRGWMLRPEQYAALYEALAQRGYSLINDPAAYRHCHYLPESYDVIRSHTPRTVWLHTDGMPPVPTLMDLLRCFDGAPVVLKDFVKSQKHYWEEACYIPSAADPAAVERVVRRFVELQGPDLSEGLVFREFVPFEPVGSHSRSGMPLTREYRIFWLDGEPLFRTRYWEEGEYGQDESPPDLFRDVARNVRSRFFTMDVARRIDGEWMIVELGDGQVAGLPEGADVPAFAEFVAQLDLSAPP
jgi:hypothetical protein